MGAPGGLHSPARLVAVALAVIRVAVGWAVVATVVVHRGFRFALSLDFQPVAIGGFRFRVRPATEAVTDGATGVAILIDGGDTEAGVGVGERPDAEEGTVLLGQTDGAAVEGHR
jgi:hypothetical protein